MKLTEWSRKHIGLTLDINERGMRYHAFAVVVTSSDIYNECNYVRLGGDLNAVPVCDNDRRHHYPSKVISFRSFKNLNEDELLKDLGVAPWHVGDIFASVDDRYFYWSKLVNDVLDNHAPQKKLRVR